MKDYNEIVLNKVVSSFTAGSLCIGDLLTIICYCKVKDIVVELGTNTGSTAELLSLMVNGIVYTVDVFEHLHLIEDSNQRLFYTNNFNQEKTEIAVTNRLKPFSNVRIISNLSYKEAKNFVDDCVGTLFIDADHSYTGVQKDFEAWLPKVETNGILLFHDICGGFPELVQFYQAVLQKDKRIIEVINSISDIKTTIKIFQKTGEPND